MIARSLGLYTYSTHPRGSVVHTAFLAEALHDAGWDVTVYALAKAGAALYRPLRAPLRLVPAALVRLRRQELAAFVRAHGRHHDLHHAQDCLTATALLDLRDAGWPGRVV